MTDTTPPETETYDPHQIGGQHPVLTQAKWREAVAACQTRRGYREWVDYNLILGSVKQNFAKTAIQFPHLKTRK